MRRCRQARGQSLVESALLIALVATALAGMFGYIRASIAHRMKTSADGISQGRLYW